MPSALAVLRLITKANFVGCNGQVGRFCSLQNTPGVDADLPICILMLVP